MKKWLKITLGVIGGVILLFVIDLICIFTINKPLFAIKEDNGDSINLVYKGLIYDTYICHEHSVPQIKVKGAKFTCAFVKFDETKESKYIPTEVENVSISISDISLTGATVIIKDTNENPYTQGEWYKIEKQIDGKWYEIETLIDNYGFNSIGYLPDENNEVKHIIDWEWLYGELSLGSYRIIKEVGNKYISIEFAIATTSNKKIEVIKPEYHNDIKFNDYLKRDNRTIYMAGNIEEIYYTESNTRISLKDYITKTYQTTDDAIKHLTHSMNLIETLKDGGTTIYKSSEYDITIIKCNTIAGDKNIFIGDYSMNFDSDLMCK